jgi:hypothetical protein
MTNLTKKEPQQLDIEQIEGKTKIIFKKADLKGKVSQSDIMDMALVAAHMQIQKYIEKLSRGAPLEKEEVKALTELAALSKQQVVVVEKESDFTTVGTADVQQLKSNLYKALIDKTKENK